MRLGVLALAIAAGFINPMPIEALLNDVAFDSELLWTSRRLPPNSIVCWPLTMVKSSTKLCTGTFWIVVRFVPTGELSPVNEA